MARLKVAKGSAWEKIDTSSLVPESWECNAITGAEFAKYTTQKSYQKETVL